MDNSSGGKFKPVIVFKSQDLFCSERLVFTPLRFV